MRKSYRILDGYAWITAVVLLAIIIISALCGCAGKRKVTEQIYVHDTLIVTHTDTLSVERWNYRHDTIRVESERIVTLLQPQDKTLPRETIRVESNNWHWQREVVRDSSSKVVVRVDSILKVLDEMRNKKDIKKVSHYNWMGFALFLAIVFFCCIYGIAKKRS